MCEDCEVWDEYNAATDAQGRAAALGKIDNIIELPENFNIEGLREAVQWAEKSAALKDLDVSQEFELSWDQGVWARVDAKNAKVAPLDMTWSGKELLKVQENFCNTAACIAGSLAIKHAEVLWQESDDPSFNGKVLTAENVLTKYGVVPIPAWTRDFLGLTSTEATMLFEGDNSLEHIVMLAEAFCARRGLTL